MTSNLCRRFHTRHCDSRKMPRSCHIDFSWYGLKTKQIWRPNNRKGALLTVIKPKYDRYDVTSSANNITLKITWPTRSTGVTDNDNINCMTCEWAHALLSDLIDLSHCWLNVFHLLLFFFLHRQVRICAVKNGPLYSLRCWKLKLHAPKPQNVSWAESVLTLGVKLRGMCVRRISFSAFGCKGSL